MRFLAAASSCLGVVLSAGLGLAQWTMPTGQQPPPPPPTATAPAPGQPPAAPTPPGTSTPPGTPPPPGTVQPPGTPPPPGTAPGAAPPSPQPQPPPPPPPSAGGLTAPGPVTSEPDRSDTDKKLDEAKEEDSERGLKWFYLEFEGGFEHVGLETFEVDEANLTAGMVESTASGGFIGAGLGLRLFFLTLGPRGRLGFFENWQKFSIGGELGLRFPVSIVEPHVLIGAGYTALGSFSDAVRSVPDAVSIRGFDVRLGAGLDFLLGDYFTLGIGASWELLGLTRPGVSLDDLNPDEQQSLEEAQQQALAAEGSGYGTAITVGGRLGLQL